MKTISSKAMPARRIAAVGLGLVVMVALLVLLTPRPAQAASLTVNSTADPGTDGCNSTECTLREAINVSNGLSTTDTITFGIPDDPGIPGLEVKTITPTSLLPTITDNVTIDGYTQPGAESNDAITNANSAVLKIELSGTNAPSNAFGLAVSGADAAGTTIKGLIINRFGDDGVFINAANTVIEGNFIGTNAAGTSDLGNGSDGVTLLSSGNVIGGPANAAQNVISGNGANGVSVKLASATGNIVSNNHIGTDADAEEDLGNGSDGVFVEDAPGNTIGGNSADGTLNIISGNDRHGVDIIGNDASGNKVLGNLIGLNRNGNGFSNIGNTLHGVFVSTAPQTEIGGTLAGEGNTISDNRLNGVDINISTDNKVLGNRIGTNANGSSAFGNARDGVRIVDSSNTQIGGTSAGARNVISGNRFGVNIRGSAATGNRVSGNFIGTDANGTADLGNSLEGVAIGSASGNTVGGTEPGARNIISGNDLDGVFIFDSSSATDNRVEGNFIGTDVNGTSDLGNGAVGVRVEAPGNFVGGTVAGARNVISGNGGAGVSVLGSGATGNKVQGNFIGTDVNGTTDLGNSLEGVLISGAPSNTVGGTVAEAANTVAFNGADGVFISGAAATGNNILRNSIHSNAGLGIDLAGGTENANGATQNDPKDPDTGPNNLQNKPALTSFSGLTINGNLNSTPNKTFVVRFFANPQGVNEGKSFLGQKSVTTNANGNVTFTFTAAAAPIGTQNVTATATRAGHTSEFSAPRAAQAT